MLTFSINRAGDQLSKGRREDFGTEPNKGK
jgi:hypothetical protein